MRVVADASAVAAVVFEEPEGKTVRAHLQDDTVVAPYLIDYELLNVGLVKIRRGIATELLIRAMLHNLRHFDIRRVNVASDEVMTLALRTGLTAYDASYLWLAMTEDLQLITLDRKLAQVDRALRGDPV